MSKLKALEKKRFELEQDIINGKDPFECFKTHFSGVTGSYCGGPPFKVENTMVIYRVVQWEKKPKEIQKTSYNPNWRIRAN